MMSAMGGVGNDPSWWQRLRSTVWRPVRYPISAGNDPSWWQRLRSRVWRPASCPISAGKRSKLVAATEIQGVETNELPDLGR